MSTEGADSGYISNWLSSDCDASQFSLNEGWEVVAHDWSSSPTRSAEPRSSKEYGVEARDPEETDNSRERQCTRASHVSGISYTAPLGKGTRLSCPIRSADRSESSCMLPMALFHELHNAGSHLQIALQRDMDSRKHALASIQHLSSALVQLAQHPSTNRSVVDSLRNQCLEDSADLSERHTDVLKAEEVFECSLRKLAEHEDRMNTGCTCARSSNLVRAPYDRDGMSDISQASSTTPPIVERYFELAGEECVVDERLTELEAEHHEALTKRHKSRTSFGQPMHELSPDAEDIYQRKRQELIDARGIARGQLQLQKDICLSQGINPERYRYRRMTAPSHKRFSARDMLQNLQKTGSELADHNVTGWLQHGEGSQFATLDVS